MFWFLLLIAISIASAGEPPIHKGDGPLLGRSTSDTGFVVSSEQLLPDNKKKPMKPAKKCKTKKTCTKAGGTCTKKWDCDGEVKTIKNGCSNNCVCCLPSGCIFGGISYAHNSILDKECLEMQCINGIWKFTGEINPKCGECQVDADPHIYPFDKPLVIPGDPTPKYLLNQSGEFIVTQPGFNYPASFGVNAKFEWCDYLPKYLGFCITTVTYYEPGIKVTLELPHASIAESCTVGTPSTDPACDIKVYVDGEYSPVDNSQVFFGTGGAISVFKQIIDDQKGYGNLNCMNIVGTKGLSVSLCEYFENYPNMYIWAQPSLESSLYGLCNIFTGIGTTTDSFWLSNTTSVPTEDCLNWTYSFGGTYEICDLFSESWKIGSSWSWSESSWSESSSWSNESWSGASWFFT